MQSGDPRIVVHFVTRAAQLGATPQEEFILIV
jgi:hypothetical protein